MLPLSWLDPYQSYLQVMATYMRAWMSFKFGQIRQLVSMATNKVIMVKQCCHFFSAVFHPILFILAGNDDMHESSEDFEIRSGPTTIRGVFCSWASEKNGVATFPQLFFIRSYSYLQVTMTCISAWMSLKFGQIQPRTTELAFLEPLKNWCCHFCLVCYSSDPL